MQREFGHTPHVLKGPYLFQEESILYLHINNICKIILCIVLLSGTLMPNNQRYHYNLLLCI